MKMTNFNWGANLIDPRDIVSRYEELNDELESLEEDLRESNEELKLYNIDNPDGGDPSEADLLVENIKNSEENLNNFNQSYDKDELDTLTEVINQGENSSDWAYGETLINENYFTEYIKDLTDDWHDMPSEFNSGKWPYNHMTMDWEGAAEEAKQDYIEIEVNGVSYYIRS